MKNICSTLIGLLIALTSFSQSCLPEGIAFHYQYEIDNFQANYPGCTEIEGDVLIGPGGYIYNLDGLDVLTSIGGGLRLFFNPDLMDITGLQNITSIGGWLFIEENNELTSLDGLESLDSIGGNLIIQFHLSLTNIEALSGVSYIGGDVLIEGNYNLTDLTGLDNIPLIAGSLRVIHNMYLTSLTGLEGITLVREYVEIQRNSFLSSLAGLANLNSIGGDLRLGTGFGGNQRLIDLTGLSNLHSVGGDLWILYNESLTDLTGLESLNSIGGSLVIRDDSSLVSLTGIENIAAGTIADIRIINNDSLAYCEVKSICDFLGSPNGTIEIHDNATGCNSQEEVEAACLTGLEESAVSSQQSAVWIYPNPATSTITISTPATSEKNTILSLTDITGKEVLKRELKQAQHVIDVSGLPRGVYFVRITGEDAVWTGRFIKEEL
jgi:hypothetical protein